MARAYLNILRALSTKVNLLTERCMAPASLPGQMEISTRENGTRIRNKDSENLPGTKKHIIKASGKMEKRMVWVCMLQLMDRSTWASLKTIRSMASVYKRGQEASYLRVIGRTACNMAWASIIQRKI